MNMLPQNYYSPLPDERQTLLLKACLLDGDDAIQSWEKWMTANGFDILRNKPSSGILPQVYDTLDFSSQRLLALLYKRMSAASVNHPLIASLKGYYRYIWVQNQLLRDQLKTIVQALTAEGVSHMVIKGFPTIEAYYKDFGARPVLDLDLIVHPDHWDIALKVFTENGWLNKDMYKPAMMPQTLVHGVHFVKDVFEVDLHIRFHDLPFDESTLASFWNDAVYYKPDHKMLSPEHQFVSTLLHGYSIEGDSVLRTFADATSILRTTPTFNWTRVLTVIQRNSLQIPAKVLLEYLKRENFFEVPQQVLDSVQNYSLSSAEAKYFKLLTTKTDANGYRQLKIRLAQLKMMKASLTKQVSLLVNTYQYQWDAYSIGKLLYRTGQVIIDKIKSPDKKVVTRKF